VPGIARTELYSGEGELLLEVEGGLDPRQLAAVASVAGDRALAVVCGADGAEAGGTSARVDTLRTAEALELVSRRGCVKGFLTILPRGALLERCVRAFNRDHLEALEATAMEFPLVFDRSDPAMAELTASYEKQDRIFRVEGSRGEYRLSYAADPGLFGWLAGSRLDPAALPFAIFSPTPVFRQLRSGEVGGVDRQRQYHVPDLHLLTEAGDATSVFVRCAGLAAEGARFWFGEDFAQFAEVVAERHAGEPELGRRLAQAAGRPTVVRVLERRPRYYAIKGGIVVPAGFGGIMLYNLQLDDTNGERFDIRLPSGDAAHIVHGTVAGGWPKLLPLAIGRGLAGLGAKVLPPELAAEQVVCLPIDERHRAAAGAYADRLRGHGLRVTVEQGRGQPLGARLRAQRARWQPHHVVFGDRELGGEEPLIASPVDGERFPLERFLDRFGERLRRCTPGGQVDRVRLPFAS
jgi:threonyl-tRNA synthetase